MERNGSCLPIYLIYGMGVPLMVMSSCVAPTPPEVITTSKRCTYLNEMKEWVDGWMDGRSQTRMIVWVHSKQGTIHFIPHRPAPPIKSVDTQFEK